MARPFRKQLSLIDSSVSDDVNLGEVVEAGIREFDNRVIRANMTPEDMENLHPTFELYQTPPDRMLRAAIEYALDVFRIRLVSRSTYDTDYFCTMPGEIFQSGGFDYDVLDDGHSIKVSSNGPAVISRILQVHGNHDTHYVICDIVTKAKQNPCHKFKVAAVKELMRSHPNDQFSYMPVMPIDIAKSIITDPNHHLNPTRILGNYRENLYLIFAQDLKFFKNAVRKR